MLLLAVTGGTSAYVGGRVLDPLTFINAPPFYGIWRNALGWSALTPIAVAGAVLLGARHRDRVTWRWVLLGAVVMALAWSASLGVSDNIARLTQQLHGKPDYANGLGAIGNHPGGYLATFNELARGPSAEVIARGYPVHVQGHPPGAVLTLWMLTQVGFSPIGGGIALVWSGVAATVLGVLVSVRRLAGEAVALAAAPFVVLLPAAVWSHTFDSFFAGVGALAVMSAVCAIVPAQDDVDGSNATRDTRASIIWALASGVLFGYLALLSYGLVLLAFLPVIVALTVKRWRPLIAIGVAGLATMAVPAAWGFNWFGGLATTHHQYVTTVAQIRPYRYFVAADLVIAAVAIGPAVVAGFLLAVTRRPIRASGWWRGAGPLIVGALVAVLTADLTGLAKSEVERIFQPFYPWLALAGVAIAAPAGASRHDRVETVALSTQAVLALVLATQLRSPW